jgi:dihydrofolate reductase
MTLTCHAFIAASLDGYIARADGSIDWLEPFNAADEDHGFDAFLADKDGIIMGRGTYETVLGFGHWPYALPVIVLSHSLTVDDIPDSLADSVAITDMDPSDLIAALTEEGWQKVYVDGGQVIQSFLRDGLLTEITVTRVPLLLGQGRPLFAEAEAETRLTLQGSHSFPSGLVTSTYRVVTEQ